MMTLFPPRITDAAHRCRPMLAGAVAALLGLGGQAASAADYLALSFGAYRSSPVLLTHFSVETALADWGWRLRYVGGAPAGAREPPHRLH